MAYVDQKRGPSATGLASAVLVQVAIGAAVITGLSVTQFIKQEPKNGPIIDFPAPTPTPPPPDPVEPVDKPQDTPDVSPPITVPDNKFDFDVIEPQLPTTDRIFPPLPPTPQPKPTGIPRPDPIPTATPKLFDPVSAKPRNDPGRWLSDRDYKPSWARRDLTGVARFQLDISAQGQVSGCRIVGSTGHSELDDATCVLVQKRARFEPARGKSGEPVLGSYTGSVLWQLPE